MVYYGRYRKGARKPAKKSSKPRRKYARSSGIKKLSSDVRLLKRKIAGEKKTFTDGLVPQTSIG